MTEVSRRAVLGAGAGAAGLVLIGAGQAGADAAAPTPTRVPVRAHYARSVRRTFTAVQGRRTYRLTLESITDTVGTTARQRQDAFILVFRPAARTQLHDGIYSLRRRGVRSHMVMMSSVGSDGRMQVVVNRTVR